jgi:hypothetical protein
MSKKIYFILTILIPVLLISCKPVISGVIQDTSCSPPCWKGITPGQTTRQETLSILNALPEVDQSTIRPMSVVNVNDSYYWDFIPHTGDIWARVFIDQDIVFAVNFFPDKKGLPLGTAIQYLGEPEKILVIWVNGDKSFVTIYSIYQSKGVVLASLIMPYHRDELAEVNSETLVDGFWYFEPGLFTELMTSNYVVNLNPEVLSQRIRPWPGYGDITQLIVEQR